MNALQCPSLVVLVFFRAAMVCAAAGLLPDPSFEQPKPKDRWGFVFTHWGGWIYEGQCEYRVSDLAHSGKHSLLIVGGTQPKVRAAPLQFTLEPGRYRVTAWLRGLDIGTGLWNQTTEFMFEEKYMPRHIRVKYPGASYSAPRLYDDAGRLLAEIYAGVGVRP